MYVDYESKPLKWIQIATVQGSVRNCGEIDFPGIYIRLDDPLVFNFIQSSITPREIPETG
jgi:hypothetical protein